MCSFYLLGRKLEADAIGDGLNRRSFVAWMHITYCTHISHSQLYLARLQKESGTYHNTDKIHSTIMHFLLIFLNLNQPQSQDPSTKSYPLSQPRPNFAIPDHSTHPDSYDVVMLCQPFLSARPILVVRNQSYHQR